MPEWLENVPTLHPACVLYFEAFYHLVTCRYYESGPIPWTEIRSYAETYNFDEDQAFILHNVIPALNEAHIAHFSKLGKTKTNEPDTIRSQDEEDREERRSKFIGAR